MTQQIQQYTPQQIVGIYSTAADASAKLAEVLDKVNLVSPATSIGAMPEGCEVNFSLVRVNTSATSAEVYSTGNDKLGIAKVVLDRIAAAAGVSWDAAASGRLDDGRDPRYCHFRAVGYVREFDGTERTIVSEKVMDLREGSPTVEGLREQVAKKNAERRAGTPPKSADLQVREMRMHIVSHAESKARLRAVRGGLGIQTGYTAAELKKPFLIVRCSFSGRTTNPQLAAEGYRMRMQAAVSGRRALFGPPPALAMPALAQYGAPADFAPIDDDDREVVEAPPSPRPSPSPTPQTRAPARQEQPQAQATQSREASGLACPFGRNKGVPLEELEDEGVTWWRGVLEKDLNDETKSKYHAKCRRDMAALDAELAFRANPPADQDPPDDGPPPGYVDDADRY